MDPDYLVALCDAIRKTALRMQRGQSQQSLTDQMAMGAAMARSAGLYDLEDFLAQQFHALWEPETGG